MQTSSTRLAYLDWLRILAIAGVLFFHSAMAYVSDWGWHIKNNETSNLLLEFNYWLHNFRMPLLFFISGTVSYCMLQKKSGGSFIGLRFRRLFIPLIFGMFFIVPPQIYVERVSHGYQGSFFEFFPSVFTTGPYPKGNLSWHHLWFILYLLIYDIICTPLFVWLISEKGKKWLQKLNWIAKGKWVYLLIIPTVIVFCSFSLKYPETNDLVHDYCRLIYWLLFLLVGFFCIANPLLMDSLERNRRTSLAGAFLTIVAINYVRWNKLEPWDVISNWHSDWRTYAFLALHALTAWFWVLTAIGYGKKYLNKKHSALNYLNQAVYPFYILHQTVILVLVFYIVQTKETILMKYIFTTGLTFIISMAIYHLFIRPYAITRFLFGMKPQEKSKKTSLEPKAENKELRHDEGHLQAALQIS